jgi:hypothetical protein
MVVPSKSNDDCARHGRKSQTAVANTVILHLLFRVRGNKYLQILLGSSCEIHFRPLCFNGRVTYSVGPPISVIRTEARRLTVNLNTDGGDV